MIAPVARLSPEVNRVLLAPVGHVEPPKHLSPSSVKDYLGCSLRYFFGRVMGLPRTGSPGLVLGKAVHGGLQVYHRSRWRQEDTSLERILATYRDAFAQAEAEDGPIPFEDGQREETLNKGELILKAYLESEYAEHLGRIAGVEVGLREPLPGIGKEILGYVDLVRVLADGRHVPVDFKTVASTPNPEIESMQHELQLTVYQLMVEAATGAQVARREIVYLTRHKVPKVIVHQLPAADKGAKQRVMTMIEAAERGIGRGEHYPQPGTHCSWCDFREQCRKWKGDTTL